MSVRDDWQTTVGVIDGLRTRIAELEEDLKHLHSRWDWTEYWFDNLYPTDWERCQTRYDATKAGAQPVARRQQGEGGGG